MARFQVIANKTGVPILVAVAIMELFSYFGIDSELVKAKIGHNRNTTTFGTHQQGFLIFFTEQN